MVCHGKISWQLNIPAVARQVELRDKSREVDSPLGDHDSLTCFGLQDRHDCLYLVIQVDSEAERQWEMAHINDYISSRVGLRLGWMPEHRRQ